jgi:hypothetical protein
MIIKNPSSGFLSYAEEYADHGKMIVGHGKDSHTALTSVSVASMFVNRSSYLYLPVHAGLV